MALPAAVQLYTFRDPQRFGGIGLGLDVPTLMAIAEAGFVGVETVDVPGGDAAEARRVLDDLDLAITSSHSWADVADRDDVARRAEAIAELGSGRMIISLSARAIDSMDGVDATIDAVAAAAEIAAGHGLRLGLHNHSAEMALVDGTPVIDRLVAGLGDAVDLQLDIFWVTVGGADPAEVIDRLGPRVVSLHLKDGIELPSSADADDFVNVPVGAGVVAVDRAIEAAKGQPSIEWLIVEFDHVDGPPIDAARTSLDNLAARGLVGRRQT